MKRAWVEHEARYQLGSEQEANFYSPLLPADGCPFETCQPEHCDDAEHLEAWMDRYPNRSWAELPCLGLPAFAYRTAQAMLTKERIHYAQTHGMSPSPEMYEHPLEQVAGRLLKKFGGRSISEAELQQHVGLLFASQACRLEIHHLRPGIDIQDACSCTNAQE